MSILDSFVLFPSSQQTAKKPSEADFLDDIFKNIVGAVPDTGKSLEEYKAERMRERYEIIN